MANEITVTFELQLAKGSHRDQFAPGQLQVDQTGIGGVKKVFSVTTTEAVLAFAEVTTPGYVVFQNLDATNFVTIGPESAGVMVPFVKLLPGEFASMRLSPGAVIRADADTATIRLLAWVIED